MWSHLFVLSKHYAELHLRTNAVIIIKKKKMCFGFIKLPELSWCRKKRVVKIAHFLKADCYLVHICMSHWANLNCCQSFTVSTVTPQPPQPHRPTKTQMAASFSGMSQKQPLAFSNTSCNSRWHLSKHASAMCGRCTLRVCLNSSYYGMHLYMIPADSCSAD